MLHLAAKELKLERTKRELMEPCTFTPDMNKSSPIKKIAVSDRLHSEAKRTTPKKSNGWPLSQKKSPTSVNSAGSKSTSSRLDQLYQDGLRRAQSRKPTDKLEEEARIRRMEERELEQCTFKPNMDWRKKTSSHSNGKPSPDGTKDTSTNRSNRSRRSPDSPPVDIVTTQAMSTPNERQPNGPRQIFVSPLREPDAADTIEIESLGDDTEYGSI